MKQLFRSGDIVKFGEVQGELRREVTANGTGLCLVSDKLHCASFNEDGSMSGYLSQFGCVLTLVHRPKRMIVKYISKWFNLEQNGDLRGPYIDHETAVKCAIRYEGWSKTFQVELSGEYEVEEQ